MSKLLMETEKTIEREGLLKRGDHVIVGLSGGPDSLCLFSLLLAMKEKWNLTLEAVHINHNLRKGSQNDQEFVEEFCRGKDIPCHVFSVDCQEMASQWKMTTEEAGRKIRYDSYEKVAREKDGIKRDSIKIAVGQNKNDQGETLLFRMMRGTGIDGLSAMDFARKGPGGFWIIRPLLGTLRKEIEKYCEEEGLAPRRDETNEVPIYTRNKIRLELMPYIKENFNENIEEALLRLSQSAGEDRDYLKGQAEISFEKALLKREGESLLLEREALRQLPRAILSRVLLQGLDSLGLTRDVERKHLVECEKFIKGEKTTGSLSLPKGYSLNLVYEKVELEGPKGEEKERFTWKKREAAYEEVPLKKGEAIFDLDLLEKEHPGAEIVVRTRETGDYLALKVGRKKIQDLFVDMKIPVKERNILPLVAIGKEILWIPQKESMGKFSCKYRVNKETKRVIVLEVNTCL